MGEISLSVSKGLPIPPPTWQARAIRARSALRRPVSALRNVLGCEASGGPILMAIAALAIAIASSGWSLSPHETHHDKGQFLDCVRAALGFIAFSSRSREKKKPAKSLT